MKLIHKKRLLKLAKHLRSGKLGHKKFDFTAYNAKRNSGNDQPHKCGFSGCALGECPVIFRSWFFDRNGEPCISKSEWAESSARKFFNLCEKEEEHLFHPNQQNPKLYGGRQLSREATAKQVAANIEAFVKRKERDRE